MGNTGSLNYSNITPLFTIGLWQVHLAVQKNNGQTVSLWQIDIRTLKSVEKNKKERNKIIQRLFSSVQLMSKMNHPNILKIYDMSSSLQSFSTSSSAPSNSSTIAPPVTSKNANNLKYFSFVSEPIEISLSTENIYKKLSIDEKIYIVQQIAVLFKYLHNDLSIAFMGLCPEAIVLSDTFQVKLCMFLHSTSQVSNDAQVVPYDFSLFSSYSICSKKIYSLILKDIFNSCIYNINSNSDINNNNSIDKNVCISSPEVFYEKHLTRTVDVFNYALVFIYVFYGLENLFIKNGIDKNSNKCVIDCDNENLNNDKNNNESINENNEESYEENYKEKNNRNNNENHEENNNFNIFLDNLDNIVKQNEFPKSSKEILLQCLNTNPAMRPSFDKILASPFFTNSEIALNIKDFDLLFYTKTEQEKIDYFANILKENRIFLYSERIQMKKFFPLLYSTLTFIQTSSNNNEKKDNNNSNFLTSYYLNLLVAIIPVIFKISSKTIKDDEEFVKKVLDKLKPTFSMVKENPFLGIIYLRSIDEVFIQRVPVSSLCDYIQPIILNAITSSNNEFCSLGIQTMNIIISLVDSATLTSIILPQIIKILNKTENPKDAVAIIQALTTVIPSVGPMYIANNALPVIKRIWIKNSWISIASPVADLIENFFATSNYYHPKNSKNSKAKTKNKSFKNYNNNDDDDDNTNDEVELEIEMKVLSTLALEIASNSLVDSMTQIRLLDYISRIVNKAKEERKLSAQLHQKPNSQQLQNSQQQQQQQNLQQQQQQDLQQQQQDLQQQKQDLQQQQQDLQQQQQNLQQQSIQQQDKKSISDLPKMKNSEATPKSVESDAKHTSNQSPSNENSPNKGLIRRTYSNNTIVNSSPINLISIQPPQYLQQLHLQQQQLQQQQQQQLPAKPQKVESKNRGTISTTSQSKFYIPPRSPKHFRNYSMPNDKLQPPSTTSLLCNINNNINNINEENSSSSLSPTNIPSPRRKKSLSNFDPFLQSSPNKRPRYTSSLMNDIVFVGKGNDPYFDLRLKSEIGDTTNSVNSQNSPNQKNSQNLQNCENGQNDVQIDDPNLQNSPNSMNSPRPNGYNRRSSWNYELAFQQNSDFSPKIFSPGDKNFEIGGSGINVAHSKKRSSAAFEPGELVFDDE